MNLRAVFTPKTYASSCKGADWDLPWVVGRWHFDLFNILFIIFFQKWGTQISLAFCELPGTLCTGIA
jgi:hypothetical protein